MNQTINNQTSQLADRLLQNKYTICTAESCTGGLIAKTFTDLAGSSEWFERGFVTYSNQAKIDMLGVKATTLASFGAVSEQVAEEMVSGALQHSQADVALSVTGIAGPGGGTESKPVGTVVFGFAIKDRSGKPGFTVVKKWFKGERNEVREASLLFAMRRVNELLTQNNQ